MINASAATEPVPGLGRVDRNRFAGSPNALAGWWQNPFWEGAGAQ